MKNIFVAVLIFVFVMCFFFIPHTGANPVTKTDILFCLDSGILSLDESYIVLTAQTPLVINLNTTYENDLLCETRYASTRPTKKYANTHKALALTQGITVYKATSPRSFHVGK